MENDEELISTSDSLDLSNNPTDEKLDDSLLPELFVYVNAGFGNKSYLCKINSDSTWEVPRDLVKELGMEYRDSLAYRFDREDGILYVEVVRNEWKKPDWLEGVE